MITIAMFYAFGKLIISAVVAFGVYQASDMIDDWTHYCPQNPFDR